MVRPYVTSVTKHLTHTQDGKTVYTATANYQNKTYTDEKTVVIPAMGHSYGYPCWTWSEDNSSATETFTCTGDDDTQPVKATVDITVTHVTLLENGKCVRTVSVELQGKTYRDTLEETLIAPVKIGTHFRRQKR